ncbi:MAG: hypothetical protein Q9M39_03775 [Sulfurovum sp.]|nr:hypothetical protein [Sulfurovum sp.]
MLESDWYYLTDIKINGGHTKDTLNDYFKFEDGLGRKIICDSGLFVLENNGKIISSYGTKKHFIKKIRLRSLFFSPVKPNDFQILTRFEIWTPPKPYSYYIKNSSKVDNSCVWINGKDDVFF